ncbi:MAG: hypothetical protein AB8B62_17710 [Roseobacter sp.]
MPRWLWWTPLVVVTLACALFWFRMGWIAAFTTETEVINTYAARYLENRKRDGTAEGAKPTDCAAYPGQAPGIWLVIRCGPTPFDPTRHYEYHVNRLGNFEYGWNPHSEGTPPSANRPET